MSGIFTRSNDDLCNRTLRETRESIFPGNYQLQRTKYVNCSKCEVVKPQQLSLVDVESELKNITRFNSRCPQFKYSPSCKFSLAPGARNSCVSTYSNIVPTALPAQVCPDTERYLYFNNGLIRPSNPLRWPSPLVC